VVRKSVKLTEKESQYAKKWIEYCTSVLLDVTTNIDTGSVGNEFISSIKTYIKLSKDIIENYDKMFFASMVSRIISNFDTIGVEIKDYKTFRRELFIESVEDE
jgi:hypothetical protein